MERIGSRTRGNRNDAGAHPESRRIRAGQHFELGDRLDRGLHHNGVKGVFVVDDAVDDPGVGVRLATQGVEVRCGARVKRAGAGEIFPCLSRGYARNQVHQLGKVSSVERKILHLALAHHLTQFGAVEANQRGCTGNFYGFACSTRLKAEIHLRLLIDIKHNIIGNAALKTFHFDGDAISSGNEKGNIVVTLGVGLLYRCGSFSSIGNGDGSSSNHGAGCVTHRSQNAAGGYLGHACSASRKQQNREERHNCSFYVSHDTRLVKVDPGLPHKYAVSFKAKYKRFPLLLLSRRTGNFIVKRIDDCQRKSRYRIAVLRPLRNLSFAPGRYRCHIFIGVWMMKSLVVLLSLISLTQVCRAASIYTTRLEDSAAVYLTDARGDGVADDSAAVQAAIDKVQAAKGEGIVFIPQGRYRITRTIYLWPGVRVIGYGAERPVFVLGEHTPGYQDGIAYMFFFAGARPRPQGSGARMPFHFPPTPRGVVPPSRSVPDANPGTFYSAISNVDFAIGAGNEGAVAIRFHAAQHAFLSHIDFALGSGFAGLHEVANEAEDLHFHGGKYGIMARKPSPAWQFTLIDSSFDGQKEAAIRENEAGLTLVHDEFRDVPAAVEIDPHYSDQLWIKDSRFENISGPAVVISNDASRMTEINMENVVCRHVPVFARLRESGREFRQVADTYAVSVFSHGLGLAYPGAQGAFETRFDAAPLSALPSPTAPAIKPLPAADTWVNVHSLGVKGDNETDDTAALQKAIDEHPVLYFPSGRYLLHDTVKLRPDSVLIGLHPSTTQFDLPDGTQAFEGPGGPKPLLEAPVGGSSVMTGLGIFTGGLNGRATGLLWHAGKDSLVDDVRFLGGHGTNAADGSRMNPYNATHSADPNPHRPWDAQYPSLWVDGGGGTFANIWTPDTFAQAGMLVSNTTVPGFVYEVSSEHHMRAEFKFNGVANWELYALQTEEESGESQNASSLEIDHSHDLTIANYHGYRVTHMEKPFPYAVRIADSSNIHFRNVHVDANSSIGLCDAEGACRQAVRSNKVPFEDAIVDQTLHTAVRDREFAWLDVNDDKPLPKMAAKGPNVERLATGFFNISGGAVDSGGSLYFVDAQFQRIYRWSAGVAECGGRQRRSAEPG